MNDEQKNRKEVTTIQGTPISIEDRPKVQDLVASLMERKETERTEAYFSGLNDGLMYFVTRPQEVGHIVHHMWSNDPRDEGRGQFTIIMLAAALMRVALSTHPHGMDGYLDECMISEDEVEIPDGEDLLESDLAVIISKMMNLTLGCCTMNIPEQPIPEA